MNPLTKFTISSRKTKFEDMLPWNISHLNTKTAPIIHKLCDETRHLDLSLTESQCKPRQ